MFDLSTNEIVGYMIMGAMMLFMYVNYISFKQIKEDDEKKYPNQQMVSVEIVIPENLYDNLHQLQSELDISRDDMFVQALDEFVKKYKE
jgi:hypothetical protein